jgi:hypothetical protein
MIALESHTWRAQACKAATAEATLQLAERKETEHCLKERVCMNAW